MGQDLVLAFWENGGIFQELHDAVRLDELGIAFQGGIDVSRSDVLQFQVPFQVLLSQPSDQFPHPIPAGLLVGRHFQHGAKMRGRLDVLQTSIRQRGQVLADPPAHVGFQLRHAPARGADFRPRIECRVRQVFALTRAIQMIDRFDLSVLARGDDSLGLCEPLGHQRPVPHESDISRRRPGGL